MSAENLEEPAILIDGDRIRSATKAKTFGNINPAGMRDVGGQFQASFAADARAAVRSDAKD